MNIIRYQRYPQSELSPAFDRLSSLREEMDRLFEASFRTSGSLSGWSPALDVYQDKDQFTVVAELPGFRKEEIEISLHQGALTISGERKPEASEGEGVRNERFFGRFQRTIALASPVDAAKVRASYQDGVLKIELPKAEEAKPKQIEVSVS
jgi:HSP20 family protein